MEVLPGALAPMASYRPISFTVLPDVQATTGLSRGSATWPDLCAWLLDPGHVYPSKARCPLVKLATFGELRSAKGSLRHDANVLTVHGIEGDYDAEALPVATAAQMLQNYGIEALLYTSPSHTPGRPRWRVLAPLSTDYAPEHRAYFVGLLNAALGGVLATESFTCSQSYYFGRVDGAPFESMRVEGAPIDVAMRGKAPVIPVSRAAPAVFDDWRDTPVPEWSGPTDDDELLQRLLNAPQSAAAAFGSRASFRDLWEGNVEALGKAFPDSHEAYNASEADAALVAHLAWATGKNHERIRVLMWRSTLSRPKWEREDYLPRTIERIVGRQQRVLQDRPAPLTGAAAAIAGPPSAPAPAQNLAPGLFAAAASGVIQASLMNVIGALRSAEGGVTLGYDSFLDRITLGGQALRDVDYVKLRLSFEERGFKSVPADIMRDAVRAVAYDNTYDSLLDWASGLVWDGQPRVETALSVYFGCEDTRYTRAVSRYLFTALAGRALDPGCQADMALIFVGGQGERKTHAVRALAPVRVAFGNADLGKVVEDDGVSARRIRGKAVVELGELRGLASRDDEAVKEWVSRRYETWTPKFVEFETLYPRRCVAIGTSNRDDLLTDPTGNRRWLPARTGHVDDAAIERDRDQLWSEGVAMWRANGIAWQEAEHLAMHEHDEFRQVDPWEPIIEEWLALPFPPAPGEVPSPTPKCAIGVTLRQIAEGPLRIAVAHLSRREELRIGKVMRALNYGKVDARVNGVMSKVWRQM